MFAADLIEDRSIGGYLRKDVRFGTGGEVWKRVERNVSKVTQGEKCQRNPSSV